jgi:5-formyltetrahydrofolate cyclo-ligase
MNGSKSELRKSLLRKRKALPPPLRARLSRRIAHAVNRLPEFKSGARVAVYLPFGSEVDTSRVMQFALRRGVKLYVPLVVGLRRRKMLFVPLDPAIKPGTERTIGYRNVSRQLAARWFNLILVPVVGIDADGHRLGMGAGFYDRSLAFRRRRTRWRGPRTVALAFDCQRVDSVLPQSWDARLDAVISESGLSPFHASRFLKE